MQLLDDLFAYEERASATQMPRPTAFVKNNAWYVNERYMRKIFAYPMLRSNKKIPGLYRTSVFGLMKKSILSRHAREFFPSSADAIQTKRTGERLRAFFSTDHGHRSTLKIVRNSRRYDFTEGIKREVSVREQLASLGTINIPRILASEQRNDAFLLCDETILGRRFNARTDRTLYRECMLPQLRDTYLAYGVQYVPIQSYFPPEMGHEVEKLLEERSVGMRFRQALRGVADRNPTAAVSLCHGGLRPCNLAVANGTIYFLDWKRAGENLIISDLIKTAVKYPKIVYLVREIRGVMSSYFLGAGSTFEELLTVAIALEILSGPGRIPKLLRIWRRHALKTPAT